MRVRVGVGVGVRAAEDLHELVPLLHGHEAELDAQPHEEVARLQQRAREGGVGGAARAPLPRGRGEDGRREHRRVEHVPG